MTNKDFKEGMRVTCELDNVKADDASLKQEGRGNWYINATHNGILQDWWIGDGSDLERHGVTNLQPKHRTIDDLECGDYVINDRGDIKKCLGKCGEVYFMSMQENGQTKNDGGKRFGTYGNISTLYELKKFDGNLYQEPEPTEEKETESVIDKLDDCVKTFFSQADELIKNLKK